MDKIKQADRIYSSLEKNTSENLKFIGDIWDYELTDDEQDEIIDYLEYNSENFEYSGGDESIFIDNLEFTLQQYKIFKEKFKEELQNDDITLSPKEENTDSKEMTKEKALKTPYDATYYAINVLQGPFPEGEDIIANDPFLSYEYADQALHGRFLKGENTIAKAKDNELAFWYADDILYPNKEAIKDFTKKITNKKIKNKFLELSKDFETNIDYEEAKEFVESYKK